MEIGEYVKVKEWNVIGRILKVTGRKVYIDNLGFGLSFEQIQEHSKNIIDLIKVGDYVNGYRVYHVAGHYVSVESMEKYDLCFEEQDIKTIVTKEQFESMQYRLEAEDK